MKSRYNQVLVLQFPASSLEDYDALCKLEGSISSCLDELGEVDGHDMGVGEFNIFVVTDHPKVAFEKIKSLGVIVDFMPNLKAAFRDIGKDEYAVIFPSGLDHFAVA